LQTLHAPNAEDQKRARILAGAMKVVLAYGYARTTMDDIARAADMSRPALYLLYKNKSDIYRAIARQMMEGSILEAREALGGQGTFAERMMDAIDRCMISLFAPIMASAHGAELLDMKGTLAADLAVNWRDGMFEVFSNAIEDEARATGVDLAGRGLSASILADLLLDGLEGAKSRTIDAERQRVAARGLVSVVDRSLQR